MNSPESAPPPGLSLADIYHVLFRRKSLIIGGLILGLAAAAYVFLSTPKVYESQAEVMVHYVVDNESHGLYRDSTVKDPDINGAAVINNELEILTSYNLAVEVASNIGPKEILAKTTGGTNLEAAAATVREGLRATAIKNTDDIVVNFEHRDPTLVQPALSAVIQTYLRHHKDVHRSGDNDDVLQQAADRAQADVKSLEDQLTTELNKHQIISVEDQKKDYADQLSRIDQRLNDVNENISQHQGTREAIDALIKVTINPRATTAASNNVSTATNLAETEIHSSTNSNAALTNLAVAPLKKATAEQISQYHRLNTLLEEYRREDIDLEKQQFKLESNRRKFLASRISEIQSQITKMETDVPDLVASAPVPGIPASSSGPIGPDPVHALLSQRQSETITISALQQDLAALNAQKAGVLTGVSNLSAFASLIQDLQRRKANAEADYADYSRRLKNSAFEQTLASGKTSNLTVIDPPTPPALHVSKTLKAVAMAFIACLGGGLVLAFALELYFDRSLKHAHEISARLSAPCLLSIPYLNGDMKNGLASNIKGLLPNPGRPADAVPSADTSQSPVVSSEKDLGDIVKKDARFHVFYEALRDRLIAYFEEMNFTHKPKLIAVTACHSGAGATKIAAGLAASLSNCKEGKVLLVDMNEDNGQTHQFYKGKLTSNFDDVLQGEAPPEEVQENLFVVRENPARERLSRAMPKRFTNLLPMMKSSDYDYIIFDMPPVSQISVTPRLAGFMDMVLLVVESEKTDRDAASRAVSWLADAKANIGVVLNKKRSYVPSRLLQEM
jgi:uncharacterized protein involved in exopolysaccharide biosynthesis/Mrp family chromosome partitioning ATPase